MAAIEEHKAPEKRRALGRGLDSLLPSGPRVVASAATMVVPPSAAVPAPAPVRIAELQARLEGDVIEQLSLDLIDENPYQTRRTFDLAALNELADSIKASGLAQPVVVRPSVNGRYVLVLGERRCRASKLAGKTTVSAIVRKLGDEQAAEMTIVENLQRLDLNCLEQAQAFARLSREFNLTQEQIGQRTGSSRESVANYMRLLKLPEAVLDLVGQGKIGFSEARVLLEATPYLEPSGIEEMARKAVAQDWTVKELKAQVNYLQSPMRQEPAPPKPADPNVKAAEADLQRMLGMRVRITDHMGKGTILIHYRTVDDFEHLLDALRARE